MLDRRGGSELYARDVALAMLRAGHAPVVYASRPGGVAAEIRDLTVPVLDSLDAVSFTPDLVYGQHHLPTMAALLRFPDAPAVPPARPRHALVFGNYTEESPHLTALARGVREARRRA